MSIFEIKGEMKDVLEFYELNTDTDEVTATNDHIEFNAYENGLNIEIENPWAGDSECGFGRDTSLTLTVKQIKELIIFLQKNFQ